MTDIFLLEAIGDARDEYILSAQALRTGRTARPRRMVRRWLLAALIGLLLLTVTACAVLARIRLQLVYSDQPDTPQARNVLTCLYPQTPPEGYRIAEGAPVTHTARRVVYEGDGVETILFYISTTGPADIALRPPVERTTVDLSGLEGALSTVGGSQLLTWQDEEAGYFASLFTDDAQVDLAAMARSMGAGPELPMSFLYCRGALWDVWYPQELPAGYACTDVAPVSQGCQTLVYTGGAGTITYQVSVSQDLTAGSQGEPVSVQGQPGILYQDGSKRTLVWKNEGEGFSASLETDDGTVDLAALAEGVWPGAALEVSRKYLGPDYQLQARQTAPGAVQWQPIYPQALPEGYEAVYIGEPMAGQQEYSFADPQGRCIDYTLYFRPGPWSMYLEGMGSPETVQINGEPGYYADGTLLWVDQGQGYGFRLSSADVDRGLLLTVAQSVAQGPELEPTNASMTRRALEELGDYQIAALPRTMVQDGQCGWPLEEGSWYSYVRRWYIDPTSGEALFFTYETYVSDAADTDEVLRRALSNMPGEQTEVNGLPAMLQETESGANLVWLSGTPAEGILFQLQSPDFTARDLLTLAASVVRQE